jgi:hypothetical protein
MGPTFPLSYHGGQLVVEYANVCFRSQEDCGPIARERQKVGGRDLSSLERWLKHPPSNA